MKKQLLTTVLGLVLSAFSFGQTANLPVNFDNALVNYDLVDFGGNSSVIAADPANAANKVCKTTKTITAQTWAGTTIAGTTGFSAAIGFTPTYTTITMLVYSPTVGTPIRMKVEDATNATHSVETEAVTTLANAWDTLVFDFANQATGTAAINYTYVFNKLSIFSNFGTDGATAGAKDYYYDDITFNGPSGPVLVQVDLPIRFDATNVNYALTDFGGTMSALVADPANAANKVCKTTKTNTAQTWAGTTIGGAGLATAIPFAVGSTELRMRVYSPNSGVPIRVKLEDAADGTKSVETEAITTVANAWDTLVFNFANQAAGTAAINFAYTYNKLSVFPNFGTDGATAGTKDYYYDDVEFVAPVTPVLLKPELPIRFDSTNVDYALTDFGGTMSALVADPANAANKVCKTTKTNTAQTWAGTTIGGAG